MSISPIDDRYKKYLNGFEEYFSEKALMKYRLMVEIEYLKFLSKYFDGKVVRRLSNNEVILLNKLYSNLNEENFKAIKKIEERIGHDVKAVELFLRDKIMYTSLKDLIPYIHFSLTSEDVNNISFSLLLRDFTYNMYIPLLRKLMNKLYNIIIENRSTLMLARTHGQPASPTTFGKEMAVYLYRIINIFKDISEYKFPGKLNGSVGNYNSFHIAYPDIDWISFSIDFIESLGLKPILITTQILPYDFILKYFYNVMLLNSILRNLCRDLWLYMSYQYIGLKTQRDEIGSSVMPHKVNPVFFETAEGSFEIANSLIQLLINELPLSRLQRDLSDSIIRRIFGEIFSYTFIGILKVIDGLDRLIVFKENMVKDLYSHGEVLSEAFQTVLRKEGFLNAYDMIYRYLRQGQISMNEIKNVIEKMEVEDKIKEKLRNIRLEKFIGLAIKLTDIVIKEYANI